MYCIWDGGAGGGDFFRDWFFQGKYLIDRQMQPAALAHCFTNVHNCQLVQLNCCYCGESKPLLSSSCHCHSGTQILRKALDASGRLGKLDHRKLRWSNASCCAFYVTNQSPYIPIPANFLKQLFNKSFLLIWLSFTVCSELKPDRYSRVSQDFGFSVPP